MYVVKKTPTMRERLTPTISRRSYFALSRTPRYSILFALPLLVAYEGLAFILEGSDGGIRNGADVLLRSAVSLVAGAYGSLVLIGAVIIVGGWMVIRDLRAHRDLRGAVFAAMLAESVVLALVFGVVVGTITARALGAFHALMLGPVDQASFGMRLMLSLGAGLYEELFFRVMLVSGLRAGAHILFGWGPRASGVAATIVGALIFSGFHYIGPYGDVLTLQSFAFRAIAGVVFSALFLIRGFGITAWTHALYDLFLLA